MLIPNPPGNTQMTTVVNSSPECHKSVLYSGPNRNIPHENRNQSNRNVPLHSIGNDLNSILASSASFHSQRSPTSSHTLALTSLRQTKNKTIEGVSLDLSCKTFSQSGDSFDRCSTPSSNNNNHNSSNSNINSSISFDLSERSPALFSKTHICQTPTSNSSALLHHSMSSTASSPTIITTTAGVNSSSCRSAGISPVGLSPPLSSRRLVSLNHQLQRSITPLSPTSGSNLSTNSIDVNTIVDIIINENSTSNQFYRQKTGSPLGPKRDNGLSFGVVSNSSSIQNKINMTTALQSDSGERQATITTQIDYQPNYQVSPLAPSAFARIGSPYSLYNSSRQSSVETSNAGLQPSPSTGNETQGEAEQTGQSVEQTIPDVHSGIIMASPGPALSSNSTGGSPSDNYWNQLIGFTRTIGSNTLVSRMFSYRVNISANHITSTASTASSWSAIRILNTCHLLYLIPVTSVTIARVLTTEVICNEQLFSWLTVQGVLFMMQIISACCILQRQPISSRIAIMDQRVRILLMVFMIWTIIGVGFLGANGTHREPGCSPSNDPVFSLASKIIIFHSSLTALYFLPCTSFVLSRLIPTTISSGLSRTATKPMIDKLGSTSMTEGMFGADPDEAVCAICLGEYAPDETIRFLPCRHHFHLECVDQWLFTDKSCPLCKHDIDKPVANDRNSRFQSTDDFHRNDEVTHHTTDSNIAMERFQVIVA